jgi:hypothetical protein
MYVETIGLAWAAVPLYWFNAMDGRGPHDLETSIGEHQQLMRWYADRSIPVELNEPHHGGMREARVTLEAIQNLESRSTDAGQPDPLSDATTLAGAVKIGILDAPQLKGNPFARGRIVTRIDARGACVAVDPLEGGPLSEEERISHLRGVSE